MLIDSMPVLKRSQRHPGTQENTDNGRALVHRLVHQQIRDVHLEAFALNEVNLPGRDSHINRPLPSVQ